MTSLVKKPLDQFEPWRRCRGEVRLEAGALLQPYPHLRTFGCLCVASFIGNYCRCSSRSRGASRSICLRKRRHTRHLPVT
jgi:hypothetical protein